MACRMICIKPLFEPMLSYCQLGPQEKFSESSITIRQILFRKMNTKMSPAKWRSFFLGLSVLSYGCHLLSMPKSEINCVSKRSRCLPKSVPLLSPPMHGQKCRIHDDVIKWNHFSRYWPFVWGIHRSPVNSPHKGQWRGTLMFFFYLRLNERLSKHLWVWWLETPSSQKWRHINALVRICTITPVSPIQSIRAHHTLACILFVQATKTSKRCIIGYL